MKQMSLHSHQLVCAYESFVHLICTTTAEHSLVVVMWPTQRWVGDHYSQPPGNTFSAWCHAIAGARLQQQKE